MTNQSKFIIYIILLIPVILISDESWKIYDDSQIAVVRITVDSADLDYLYQYVDNYDHFPATVHFKNAYIDEVIDTVGFRLRGNTSRYSAKKSFKLSFNTFFPGRQFYGVDKINLNGEHNDPSIIRSKLCWDFFQQIGMKAPRASHIAVYINDEYYGLYISVEHIDDEFIQSRFNDDSGNLWKCLYPADLSYRGPDGSDYYPYVDLTRPYELKTNVEANDFSALARLIDILNNTPDHQFADSLEQILVVPEVLKYLAMNVLVGSWDDYWFLMNNYYLYYEPLIHKFHLIPYDYDNTFGIDWFDVDWTAADPYHFMTIEEIQGSGRGSRPLADRLLNIATYRNLYTHFLKFFRENVFRLSLWETRLDSLKEMITPWAQNDIYRTMDYGFDLADFHNSYTYASYSNLHVKRGIKEFTNLRDASILGQMTWVDSEPIIYRLEWTPKFPQAGDTIHITSSAFSHEGVNDVNILYYPGNSAIADTIPMSFNPVPLTTIVDEADRWTGRIPPLEQTQYGYFKLMARDTRGIECEYPRNQRIYFRTPLEDTTGLVINEFLASNSSVNRDPAGEYDDWLEIYNTTSEDRSLAGLYLTDNPENLSKWEIPAEAGILSGGDFLLLWCDEDGSQQGLHTNFRISASGEFLALVASDGVSIIDSLTFGPQTVDVSFGRDPDGSDNWKKLDAPTPGFSNLLTNLSEDLILPERYKLHQNNPNPFNPVTAISYQLPTVSDVELIIYNQLGQKVSTLVSERQNAGFYQIDWEASNYASGIYYYRINAGKFIDVKKMILLK